MKLFKNDFKLQDRQGHSHSIRKVGEDDYLVNGSLLIDKAMLKDIPELSTIVIHAICKDCGR